MSAWLVLAPGVIAALVGGGAYLCARISHRATVARVTTYRAEVDAARAEISREVAQADVEAALAQVANTPARESNERLGAWVQERAFGKGGAILDSPYFTTAIFEDSMMGGIGPRAGVFSNFPGAVLAGVTLSTYKDVLEAIVHEDGDDQATKKRKAAARALRKQIGAVWIAHSDLKTPR
jgi:hypothetical protein